jgi:uncharacterized membrane protein YccC
VLRVTICMAAAQVLTIVVRLNRSYWVGLTVAAVIKPDFGSVFARALQRAVGTAIGVLIGAAVVTWVPSRPALLPFLALFAGLLPIALVRNYGMFTIFVTPLIIILIETLTGGTHQLVAARLLDTLLGCAIVLALGYLAWPETWRPRLGDRFAGTTESVATYLHQALGPGDRDRSALRRLTYRRLSDLRTNLQQSMAEPGAAGVQSVAWWPAVVALERVTDTITSAAISLEHGAAVPPEHEIDLLEHALTDLATAARTRSDLHPCPRPASAGLAEISDEVANARSAFSGPTQEAMARRRREQSASAPQS